MKSKPKKVLFILPYYDPFRNDGAKNRMHMFMDILKRNNYQIYALAGVNASIYFRALLKRDFFQKEYKWFILPFFGIFKSELLSRITSLIFRVILLYLYKKYKFNFVQAETTVGGYLSSIKPHIPLLIDYHGDILDEALCQDPSMKETSWKYKKLLHVISETAKRSKYSIFVSDKMRQLLLSQTKYDLNNNLVFPCVAKKSVLKGLNDTSAFKKITTNRIVLCYFGGLQSWQNVDRILDVIIRLRELNKNIFFTCFTPHDTLPLKSLFDKIGQDNYFIKSLKDSEINDYSKYIDASFLLRSNRPLNYVSSPTKIRESLSLGIPVVATKYSGDAETIITHNFNGYILSDVIPTDKEIKDLYTFITSISNNKQIYKDRCLNSVKNQDEAHFEKEYLNFIQNNIND